MDLKPETLEKIDKLIPRYPEKRSAVMPILQHIQDEHLHISNKAIEWVAEKLDLEPINVLEVVSFYPSYKQSPVGRKNLRVCRTLSCALVGAYDTCDKLKEKLGIEAMETPTDDGEYSIEWAECLANCGKGPNILVGDTLHDNVTADKVDEFLEGLKS